jgi:hypothetical protein
MPAGITLQAHQRLLLAVRSDKTLAFLMISSLQISNGLLETRACFCLQNPTVHGRLAELLFRDQFSAGDGGITCLFSRVVDGYFDSKF